MLLRKVLKQWFRRNIIYSKTFLLLIVFYHCSLIRHSEMLLRLTPHAHLGPALYRLCLVCHRGGSRCEGHAVWTFVSAACSQPSGFGTVPVWMARSEPSWLISSWWETLRNVQVHLPILLCVWCVFFSMAPSYYVIRLKKQTKKNKNILPFTS